MVSSDLSIEDGRAPEQAAQGGLEAFQPHMDTLLCHLLWVILPWQGVGLDKVQRSLPAQTILRFCDLISTDSAL